MSLNDPSTDDYVNANSRNLRKRLQADFKRSGVGLKGLLSSWVTPDDPSDPASVDEARRRITIFRRVLSDPYIRERADLDSNPPVEYVDETRVQVDLKTFRSELSELVEHVGAFQKYQVPTDVADDEPEAVEAKYIQETLASRWDGILLHAPTLCRFLALLCSRQRTAEVDRVATADNLLQDQPIQNRVFTILTMLTAGFSRNNSNFFRRASGIYLTACGLPRRAIETCQRLGLLETYKVLNNTVNVSSARQTVRVYEGAFNDSA